MDEIKIGAEQEIYLVPKTEKIENAEVIAKISLDVEKYPFIIGYDANEKENIIIELEKLGCDKIEQLDFANCIAVSMSVAQLKAIKMLDGIESVEKDYDYKCLVDSISESEYVAYLAGENHDINDRKEVKLAVFDTGVSNISVDGFVNFVNDVSTDENGHGTQMAGIISAVVANAENKVATPSIYSVITADHRGFAKTSTIMQALDWAINNEIKIICMSFGDYHKSKLLENMINRASKCGIIMVAAVGNDGGFEDENRIMYPAAFENVLSVGAKNGDAIANYSNGAENADCFANGSQCTTDINGNAVKVIGTSGAAAFVAGTILKKLCASPEKTSLDIIADIKAEMFFSASMDADKTLTLTNENGILINDKENIASNVTELNARSLDEGISVFSVADNDCFSNDMATAISIPFLNWQSGRITCPGNEVWYKFTANAGDVHPSGSPGWYTIHTRGSLDTIGYLYDSYGNQIAYNNGGSELNFNIWAQLDYYGTYYIRVKAYGSNTGNFDIRVSYFDDDHGNTMDSATEVIGVYYQDKSINGELHSQDDVDYYTFVPARNCVMEIYTEGDTNTYGQLYCASGGLLYSDNNSNGNGNFKITAHLEAMERYYIAVSHNSSTGYGDYTLRFKFVKDYKLNTSNKSVSWVNDDPDIRDSVGQKIYSIIFLNEDSGYKYHYEMTKISVRNQINSLYNSGQETLLTEFLCNLIGVTESFVLSTGLGLIVQMINNFPTVFGQVTFENALDEVILNNQGFVRCYNFSYVGPAIELFRDIEATGYEYYNNDYFYGEPYYRGKFYE